jgi:Icc-related predicted phosphoesterase
MRLLALGDVRGNLDALSRIIISAVDQEFDAVVLVGDIGLPVLRKGTETHGAVEGVYRASAEAVFSICSSLDAPVLFVPGDHDLPELAGSGRAHNVDISGCGKPFDVRETRVLGIGGSSRIGDMFPYEWDDEKKKCDVQAIRRHTDSSGESIWITHDVPFGTRLDMTTHGLHRGSSAIRELVAVCRPTLLVCGHIPEAAGAEMVGAGSLAVNVGSILTEHEIVSEFGPRSVHFHKTLEEQCFVLDVWSRGHIDVVRWWFANGIREATCVATDGNGIGQPS